MWRSRLCYPMITLHQHIANGVKDRIEHYNCELPRSESSPSSSAKNTLVPRDTSRRDHPVVLRPFMSEIQRIIEFTHREVLNEVQKSAKVLILPCHHFLTMNDTGSCHWVSSFRKIHLLTFIPMMRQTTLSVRKHRHCSVRPLFDIFLGRFML